MRTMTFYAVILITLFVPAIVSGARADQAKGAACAKNLPADAEKVYELAAPDVRPGTDLAGLLRSKLTPIVQSGQLSQTVARAAAQAAGPCLKDLQN